MIDWASIKPLITSQIATATGLAANRVRWVDEPSGSLDGASPVIWLRVPSVVGVGVDQEVRTDNGTGEQTVTVVGQRQFTLSIRCESFSFDIADTKYSGNVAEAIKIRLKRSTSSTARAGAFSVQQLLGTNFFSYIESNRPISTHIVDILCNTVDVDVDDTTGAGDWIGEVQGTGTIKQDDGSTISAPTFDVSYTTPPKF